MKHPLNLHLLKELCETAGAPGHEDRIRSIVRRELESLSLDYNVDNLGNVTAVRHGRESKKVMAAAHMDEISFIITHIDEHGFLRFITLGGFDPKTLTSQRVIVHGTRDIPGVMGSKPVHIMSAEEKNKALQLTDFFIDIGMNKSEAEKMVNIGDVVTRERDLIEIGDCVNCKSIDNRVSVFILLEALKKMGNDIPFDFYATFTVQEEVGIRGAAVAAHTIEPDFGIGLDTTIAFDVPGAKAHETVTRLGEGAAIKIMDSSTICDPRMVAYMKSTAIRHDIKWQPEILPAGGTDTAALQRNGKTGAISGAISIPTRHIHQSVEMANKHDINACIHLMKHCVEDLDTFDWSARS